MIYIWKSDILTGQYGEINVKANKIIIESQYASCVDNTLHEFYNMDFSIIVYNGVEITGNYSSVNELNKYEKIIMK